MNDVFLFLHIVRHVFKKNLNWLSLEVHNNMKLMELKLKYFVFVQIWESWISMCGGWFAKCIIMNLLTPIHQVKKKWQTITKKV